MDKRSPNLLRSRGCSRAAVKYTTGDTTMLPHTMATASLVRSELPGRCLVAVATTSTARATAWHARRSSAARQRSARLPFAWVAAISALMQDEEFLMLPRTKASTVLDAAHPPHIIEGWVSDDPPCVCSRCQQRLDGGDVSGFGCLVQECPALGIYLVDINVYKRGRRGGRGVTYEGGQAGKGVRCVQGRVVTYQEGRERGCGVCRGGGSHTRRGRQGGAVCVGAGGDMPHA